MTCNRSKKERALLHKDTIHPLSNYFRMQTQMTKETKVWDQVSEQEASYLEQ